MFACKAPKNSFALVLTALFLSSLLLNAPAEGAVQFAPGLFVELHTLEPGRVPLWPCWSSDGECICFTATDVNLMDGRNWLSEIWVMDLWSAPEATRLLTEAEGATCHCLSFVPDGSGILFQDDIETYHGARPSVLDPNTFGVERRLGIEPEVLDPGVYDGEILHCHIQDTPSGTKLVVDMEKPVTDTVSVYLIPTDSSGNPDLGSIVEIIDDITGVSPYRLALSPTGNELLFAERTTGNPKPDICLITGIDRIVTGEDQPIRSITDPRVRVFVDGPNHADCPSWSDDGSLIFYAYDFNGSFEMIEMNFDEADFDIMIVRLQDALAGDLVPTRLPLPGDQGCINASRGGTRFVFGQTGFGGHKICAIGLRLSGPLDVASLGGAYTLDQAFSLNDGSGSNLFVGPGTEIGNYEPGVEPTLLSIDTPVQLVPWHKLPPNIQGTPVQRAVRYDNGSATKAVSLPLEFDPPAQLALAYNNLEIQNMQENDLLVYKYNTQTGKFDRFLPVIAHDVQNNRITVELDAAAPNEDAAKAGDGLAEGSLAAGVADIDGDGLTDGAEVRFDGDLTLNAYNADTNPVGTDLDPFSPDTDGDGAWDGVEVLWDGDPGFNPYDPVTNPTGRDLDPFNPDSDGDGSPDGFEVTFETDPLDPGSQPGELPAAGPVALAALTAILAALGIKKRS